MPGSGPRRHDTRQRLIAPTTCRETSLPASQHYCPGASKAARDAGDDAKIAPSTAAAATNFRPRSAIRSRLPRPAQPRPNTLPRQISIDARLLTQPPRVPSWGAFERRPQHRADRSRPAGIRNPAPTRRFARLPLTSGFAPNSGRSDAYGVGMKSTQALIRLALRARGVVPHFLSSPDFGRASTRRPTEPAAQSPSRSIGRSASRPYMEPAPS